MTAYPRPALPLQSHGDTPRTRAALAPRGTRLVMAALAALMLVRFFSETLHVLPRSAAFIDVPIFFILVAVAAARGRRVVPSRSYFGLAVLFLMTAVVAAVTNLARVAPAPLLVFIYNFLSPLGIYYAVYRLWPPGNSRVFSRFLVAIGLVQFVVVGGFQLPKFLSDHNPDGISGTFGDNAYQLVFFLLVLTALLGGVMIFQRRGLTARLAPLMFVGIAAIIFLAQYRALLVTTILVVLVIAFFLMKARPGTGIVVGTLAIVTFVGSFGYVAQHFPSLKLSLAEQSIQSNPWYFVTQRIHALDDVVSLYGDNPRYIVTGTGPGTFSSRAWETFANTAETRTAVAAPWALRLNGGVPYQTDVADKYTVPRLQNAAIFQGSRALTKPFASYTSLMAEIGLPGFFLYLGIYLLALVRSISMLLRWMRRATPGDSLPALLLASTIAFFVLLQLAALDNWLEVTRITFLSWALLAIATRESDARERAE